MIDIRHIERAIVRSINHQHGVYPSVYRVRPSTWQRLRDERDRQLKFVLTAPFALSPNFLVFGVPVAPWPDQYGT